MGVSDEDGHIRINANYFRNGEIIDVYLDIIHELVHVRQFIEGKELFDHNFRYVQRPTEIEAYFHAVAEARKLGLTEQQIADYLRTERMSEEDLKLLTQALQVKSFSNENSKK